LRVVFLDHVTQLSGGELALLRLAKALRDVDSHIILADEGPLVERLLLAGISVEVLPLPQRTSQLRKDNIRIGRLPLHSIFDTLIYTLRLAWRLRQLRPDVVHTNSLKSGIYGSLAARLAGTPVVWHLRDRIADDYLPNIAGRLLRALIRRAPDVVISNSRTTSDTLGAAERSLVIPSVVEPALPTRARANPPNGQLLVGMVGRLAPWKGQDVFLRAFALAFPTGSQRAVVVGKPLFGEEEVVYAEALRQLAGELGIADRVEFLGHREDVPGELHRMDVLVHASTTPEPFGQVVIEGMSAGLPVVAPRHGGPAEIISDGVNGVLYTPGDVTELAQVLVRLSADESLRVELGSAASSRARDFSPQVVATQVMQAYALARRKKSGSDGGSSAIVST
jgi:glycosyltransferase involved in cell wall biosynthesis